MRNKIVVAAVAVGVVATSVALLRSPAPTAATSETSSASIPRPAVPPPAAPDAAPLQGTEKKLPGVWVDQVPPQAQANGALVFGLHGRGDTASNFAAIAPKLAPNHAWRFIEAPLPWRENTQWFRMDASDGGKADLMAATALLQAHIRSARGRPVAVVGFSQGCFMAAHFAATHPQEVRAVLCIGGGLVFTPEVPPSTLKPQFLFVHGIEDTIIPPARARQAKQVLENSGFSCELLEHSEAHVIPEGDMGRLRAWLEHRLN